MSIFQESFKFDEGIAQTRDNGYYFAADALADGTRAVLAAEINSLPLELGDHTERAINAGRPNQVRQRHVRAYYEYGEPAVPAANTAIDGLTKSVRAMSQFPELRVWQPTEIGYQQYRSTSDFIGPHRDRASDRLLSVTCTLAGSALVKVFEPLGEPMDYTNLQQIDEYVTKPGSVMLLRAPGLGNGEQVVHQVLPPTDGSRAIVNLRMRPTVLEQPTHPRWQQ